MARDIMYYFDKKTPFARHELGELQSDFNMGLTIDGSKDSMQVQVYGYDKDEIKPNTILYHGATNTWWIVSRDIVKRYANENIYWYTHNLTLVGAIDLLNARDLTDCGFNDNKYNVGYFIRRLFDLSSFEFPITINYGNNIDPQKKVDYIKSFENYTPSSALREFLNSYNCDAKLTFNTSGSDNHISSAILNIIPRTGNVDLPQVDIDDFDDIRETKTINKESYGTTVISNAQNVVSTLTKTYPQVGGIRLNGETYETVPSSAYIKLPSAIYKVNWVKILHPVRLVYGTRLNNDGLLTNTATLYPWSNAQLDRQFRKIAKDMADSLRQGGTQNPEWWTIYNWLLTHKNDILDPVIKASTITIVGNWKFNPTTATFVPPENYEFKRITKGANYTTPTYTNAVLLLGDKETKDSITYQGRCMYYERGSDVIKGFNWLCEYGATWSGPNQGQITEITSYKNTDLNDSSYNSGNYINHTFSLSGNPNVYFHLDRLNTDQHNAYALNTGNTYFQVSYIPMNDVKVKLDNQNNDNDIHIYNQNGKLNDSVALSKLISGYSKEIQSENITRFMHYTNFNDIPQVGSIVNVGSEKYVINNISYDFFVNETDNANNISYYIECEFTLSKYVAVKSLMVNPNSNIRDYGIPQKFNVKRRQVYRDYYELSLEQDDDANQDTPYVALDKYLYFGSSSRIVDYDHTAIMKIDYAQPVDGNESWYYQLNTTAHILEKSIYETIDFGDNNIIGYDMQNTTSGFDMSKIFDNQLRVVSTPISYVDDDGCFKGITLEFLNKENVENLYEDIIEDGGYSGAVMLSAHPFVGSNFFYGKYNETSAYSDETETWTTNMQGVGTLTYSFPKPNNYIDNSVSISNIVMLDRADNPMSSATCNVDSITETANSIIIAFSYSTGTNNDYGTLQFRVNYTYRSSLRYSGAVHLKDYEIVEPLYEKDAIEVPVFEYSMQLNDTSSVEIGSNILNGNNELLAVYRVVIRDRNTTTQLNAGKYFQGLTITGQSISVDDYAYEYDIHSGSGVNSTLESNNTIIRFQFFNSNDIVFYGDSNQEQFDYKSSTQGTQITKSNLIGKDIIIYKSKIKSMTYDIDEDVATCDYDNELMFIIHNPQESNFDGDDLLVRVNYYKLK